MTPEQQREIWLKRMLPALAILVIYFVFFSNMISADAEKARRDYESLAAKGISGDAIPGMNSQINRLNREIDSLREKDRTLYSQLQGKIPFLARTASSNETIARISELLVNNHLQIIEEKHYRLSDRGPLPRSLHDARHWLEEALQAGDDGLQILALRFTGSYLDTLRAMDAFARGQYKALPVHLLTMQTDVADENFSSDKPLWSLQLWL